uniref:NADH-ubiquinone oxidoreductase chain 4 n=1 Tax=Oecetis caucula TaxID=2904905 RepID=A0A9E8LP44_9NEOP|nr:NADH dehydrogenase subunit 4 [Oecetis caucula]UZZ44216.1 NADH dehydrogenase subunit 4 [Oecetis caucula]
MIKYLMFFIGLFFFKKSYWMILLSLIFLMMVFMLNSLDLFSLMNVSNYLGMDLLSFSLILLSIWILILMFLSMVLFYNMNYNLEFLSGVMVILLFFLMLYFGTLNLFLFYLFFESSLIPMLLMIFGWGGQLERVEAVLFLLFYTLFVSFPLMGGIFFMNYFYKSLSMVLFMKVVLSNLVLYLVMISAFLVKLPMVFVHIWLPKAHVEAPVGGSMILAGVMLKLGGYGLFRVLIFFKKLNFQLSNFMISLSLIGSIYICLVCLHQSDFKKLIAYSSVVHMGLFLGGVFTMSSWGLTGGFYMLIGHGLCSSGLFSLINLNYERFYSRSLVLNKGMISILPSFTLWWFLMLSSNMAAPFSLNLLSEIMIINSIISHSSFTMILVFLVFFLGGAYNLYFFMNSQHGKFLLLKNTFFNILSREYLMLFLHWVPLNLMFLKVDFLMMWV